MNRWACPHMSNKKIQFVHISVVHVHFLYIAVRALCSEFLAQAPHLWRILGLSSTFSQPSAGDLPCV